MNIYSINSRIKRGQLTLNNIPYDDGLNVLVIVVPKTNENQKTQSKKNLFLDDENYNSYQEIKQNLLKKYPDLGERSQKKILDDFERSSQKVSENIPFKNVDECIKAMRRENRL
ncbi:hypothetical protein MHK_003953 [Candidatus Magnetomorum sp. HK-1]|nr:hypothetical protein MHK_003953 [Candidatus Magnetomorum sp. HK-1]